MINDIDDSKAPLLDHLIELRSRLLKCVYALVITGAVCFYFSEQLFAILVHPLKEAFGDGGGRLVYTKLYEAFFVQVKIAFFGAFCLSFRSSPTSSGPLSRRAFMRRKRRRCCPSSWRRPSSSRWARAWPISW
jgi:hypothetical protein